MKKLFLFLSLFAINCGILFAEDITITTYYPSPNGSYNQLQANRLGVGDNDGSGQLTNADIPVTNGDVWIAGNVGIGTTNPSSRLEVSGSWIEASNTANTVRSAISASNGNYLSIEAFNTNNTAKLPVNINPWGGNVGIGTIIPRVLLTVGPNPLPGFNGNELFQVARTGDAYMTVRDGTANAVFGTTAGVPFVGSQTNTPFTIRLNNLERVRLWEIPASGPVMTFPVAWAVINSNGRLHIASSRNEALHLNPWAGAGDVIINGGGNNKGLIIANGGYLNVTGNITSAGNVHDACAWQSVVHTADHRNYCPNGRYMAGIRMEGTEWTAATDVHSGPEVDEIYCCTI